MAIFLLFADFFVTCHDVIYPRYFDFPGVEPREKTPQVTPAI
jgi:hypothetical protein